MKSPACEVSVILPFRDAADTIEDQLDALARQDFAGAWEIVAVDNCSRDASRQILEAFDRGPDLRVVGACDRLGAGYASNVGLRQARAEKLVFVDADDVVGPRYLAAMASALDKHDFVMSGFDYETLNPGWVLSAYERFGRDPENPLVDHFGLLPSAGASVGVKRSALEAVGGFPEDLPRMYDIAMSWELQLAGAELHYVPEAVCLVRYRSTLLDLFRQAFAGSSAAPLLYKKYRSAGMQRRTVPEALRSWARLFVNLPRARSKAELAPLVMQFGREFGRLKGSARHRVLFP